MLNHAKYAAVIIQGIANAIKIFVHATDVQFFEVKMMSDYRWHYAKARKQWVDKFFNEHHPRHEHWQQHRQLFETDELASYDDELRYALESFDECEQVKLIHDHKHGHCLKIKWEHGAWWVGDNMHFYYCILLPIDNVEMFEPAALARKKPKQRKLWNRS